MSAGVDSRRRRRWVKRGRAALIGVLVALTAYVLVESHADIVNSDWAVLETVGRIMSSDHPGHLYDPAEIIRVQDQITGGGRLSKPEFGGGLIPVYQPPWVAALMVPFAALGTDVGGRLWGLLQLAALGAGLFMLAYESGPNWRWVAAMAGTPAAVMLLNMQVDGLVVLGLGAAWLLWRRQRRFLAGLALGLCLVKPHLVVPLAVAILAMRLWPVIAGWAVALLLAATVVVVRAPSLLVDWPTFLLSNAGSVGQELGPTGLIFPLGLPHSISLALELLLLVAGTALVLNLAHTRRDQATTAMAILITGGVLVAPHLQRSDLTVLAASGAVWAGTRWFDWLALSVLGLGAAVLAESPAGSLVATPLVGAALLRFSRRADLPEAVPERV
jgi:hypothetical protein